MAIAPAVLLAVTIGAQPPPLSHAEVSAFLRELRVELARTDREAVAARVQYPITAFGDPAAPMPFTLIVNMR